MNETINTKVMQPFSTAAFTRFADDDDRNIRSSDIKSLDHRPATDQDDYQENSKSVGESPSDGFLDYVQENYIPIKDEHDETRNIPIVEIITSVVGECGVSRDDSTTNMSMSEEAEDALNGFDENEKIHPEVRDTCLIQDSLPHCEAPAAESILKQDSINILLSSIAIQSSCLEEQMVTPNPAKSKKPNINRSRQRQRNLSRGASLAALFALQEAEAICLSPCTMESSEGDSDIESTVSPLNDKHSQADPLIRDCHNNKFSITCSLQTLCVVLELPTQTMEHQGGYSFNKLKMEAPNENHRGKGKREVESRSNIIA